MTYIRTTVNLLLSTPHSVKSIHPTRYMAHSDTSNDLAPCSSFFHRFCFFIAFNDYCITRKVLSFVVLSSALSFVDVQVVLLQ